MKKGSLDYIKQLPAKEKRITLSTVITGMRILLVPFIVYAMVAQYWGAAFWLFMSAVLSDLLDGLSARMRNERTFLGACLDPIADKLLLLSCFTTLAFVKTPLFTVPQWFVFVVLAKEFLLLTGAAYLVFIAQQSIIMPSFLGKLTTLVQMLFIVWLFSCYFFHWLPIKTYWVMITMLLVLSLAVLGDYSVKAFSVMRMKGPDA